MANPRSSGMAGGRSLFSLMHRRRSDMLVQVSIGCISAAGKPAVPKGKADKVGLFNFFKLGTEMHPNPDLDGCSNGGKEVKPWPIFFQKLQGCYV